MIQNTKYMRCTGTKVFGVRAPIIKNDNKLVDIVVDSIKNAVDNGEFTIDNKDVIGITESIVARSYNQYVTTDDIANSVKEIFGEDQNITIINPILSRNRFSIILKGIAKAADKITLFLTAPKDEVGNTLYSKWPLDSYSCVSAEEAGRWLGESIHPFTGINYIDLYRDIVTSAGASCDIWICNENYFNNKPHYTPALSTNVIYAGIHDNFDKVQILSDKLWYSGNTPIVCSLASICASGWCKGENDEYLPFNQCHGLYGSNKAGEDKLKLFPDFTICKFVCDKVQEKLKDIYEKDVEVMVYGDGCFKDPVGGIWEFADPITAPYYTKGLEGTPNELKLKYLADTVSSDEETLKSKIKHKKSYLKGDMSSQGTTPRRYIDLLASLFDLVSGSGDKGTPIVIAKGYFDNFADD